MEIENKVRLALGLVLIAVLVYWFPWILADPLYTFMGHPFTFIAVAAFLASLAMMFPRRTRRFLARHRRKLVVVLLALAVVAAASELSRFLYVAKTLEVVEATQLPQLDPSSFRVVPYAVARYWAEASFTSPTHRPGSYVFLGYVNGTPIWEIPIVPEPGFNYFTKKMVGYIAVWGDSFTPRREKIDATFTYGIDHFHDIRWAAYIKAGLWGYKLSLEDAYIVRSGETYWLAIPVVGWRISAIYALPTVKGVLLASQDGDVEFLPADKAAEDPRLQGVPLVPESLARWYVEKLNYRRGIINALTYHRDMFQLKDPSVYNRQPWLLRDTEGNLWWVFAAEPWGKGGGVNRIFLVDARSPGIKVYEYRTPGDMLLIGPVRAVEQARAALPEYDWERFEAEEPIPFTLNGKLYWRVAIIPSEASTIDKLIIVNAETGETYIVENDATLARFLASGQPQPVPQTPLEKIKELQRRIQEEIDRLQQLLQELKELEEMLTNTTSR